MTPALEVYYLEQLKLEYLLPHWSPRRWFSLVVVHPVEWRNQKCWSRQDVTNTKWLATNTVRAARRLVGSFSVDGWRETADSKWLHNSCRAEYMNIAKLLKTENGKIVYYRRAYVEESEPRAWKNSEKSAIKFQLSKAMKSNRWYVVAISPGEL